MNVADMIKALEELDAEDSAPVILGHDTLCELIGVEVDPQGRGVVFQFDCYCGYVI